ncbi:4'-phosphopantetheinyl transferase superfamily protein [Clostridium botulinum]|uniref:4'-phosphopantetheinyl transferase superfamily protein n=1 Tax=Clostridium botulinum TaxID=1491 RepID=A0A6M0SSV6_CLOBO|nr:4'-phosphopantetheinyl transferase superfamily protein [Clostridium botulinum]
MKIYSVKLLDISEEILDKLCLFVDLEKKDKLKKLSKKKDVSRTLIGEILIRNIINEELCINNRQIKFKKNKYGKPYLREHPQFNFNISHSGDFIICAVDNKPIGIDIEEKKNIDYKKIARKFFTVSEFSYIVNQNLDFQLSKFYEIWTLKESYIKCCGKGLSIPLNSFSVDIDQSNNIKVIANNEYMEYTLKNFNIGSSYKMAICSLNKKIPNNIIIIDQNKLINSWI